jgi:hypothetical protein
MGRDYSQIAAGLHLYHGWIATTHQRFRHYSVSVRELRQIVGWVEEKALKIINLDFPQRWASFLGPTQRIQGRLVILGGYPRPRHRRRP